MRGLHAARKLKASVVDVPRPALSLLLYKPLLSGRSDGITFDAIYESGSGTVVGVLRRAN